MNGNVVGPGGGWPPGPMVEVEIIFGDEQDSDTPIVGLAVEALSAFPDLDRAMVRKLLPMWEHFTDLSPRDVVAIMERFPRSRGGR